MVSESVVANIWHGTNVDKAESRAGGGNQKLEGTYVFNHGKFDTEKRIPITLTCWQIFWIKVKCIALAVIIHQFC